MKPPVLALALTLLPLTLRPASAQNPLKVDNVTSFSSKQWVESHLSIKVNGDINGETTFWNEDQIGFCGQVVVAVLDGDGQFVSYFTAAAGCIRGSNGRGSEPTIKKRFQTKGSLELASLRAATRMEAKAIKDDMRPVTFELVKLLFH